MSGAEGGGGIGVGPEADVEALRGLCPRCNKLQPMRRLKAGWRLRAHELRRQVSGRTKGTPCPVQDIDAAPFVPAAVLSLRAKAGRLGRAAELSEASTNEALRGTAPGERQEAREAADLADRIEAAWARLVPTIAPPAVVTRPFATELLLRLAVSEAAQFLGAWASALGVRSGYSDEEADPHHRPLGVGLRRLGAFAESPSPTWVPATQALSDAALVLSLPWGVMPSVEGDSVTGLALVAQVKARLVLGHTDLLDHRAVARLGNAAPEALIGWTLEHLPRTSAGELRDHHLFLYPDVARAWLRHGGHGWA